MAPFRLNATCAALGMRLKHVRFIKVLCVHVSQVKCVTPAHAYASYRVDHMLRDDWASWSPRLWWTSGFKTTKATECCTCLGHRRFLFSQKSLVCLSISRMITQRSVWRCEWMKVEYVSCHTERWRMDGSSSSFGQKYLYLDTQKKRTEDGWWTSSGCPWERAASFCFAVLEPCCWICGYSLLVSEEPQRWQ